MILENNYLQLSKIIFYHSPPQSTPATQILLFLKHAKQMFMLWPLPFVQNALPPTSPKSLFNVTLPMRPYLLIFYKSVIQPSLLFPIRLRLAPYYLSPTIFIYLLSVLHFPKTSVWEGRHSFIHSTEKKWHWHSYVGKNNALNSQTKSTCGNEFQMPEENVSNSNSECIFTHASQVLQDLSHLFSDFTHTQTYQL